MDHMLLNDPVDVLIEFNEKGIRPRRIRWDKRIYDIQQVNLIHHTYEGSHLIYYFSVSDRLNFMKLRLNTQNLTWRLVEFYAHDPHKL